MTTTLYPHESIFAPIVVFIIGFGIFSYRFIADLLYPVPLSSPTSWCSSQTTILPYVEYIWLMLFGILLMASAVVILLFHVSESTPIDIKKEIEHHEDAIVKLRSGKR